MWSKVYEKYPTQVVSVYSLEKRKKEKLDSKCLLSKYQSWKGIDDRVQLVLAFLFKRLCSLSFFTLQHIDLPKVSIYSKDKRHERERESRQIPSLNSKHYFTFFFHLLRLLMSSRLQEKIEESNNNRK